MITSTVHLTETTDRIAGADAVADVVGALRVAAHLLINDEYVPPWGVAVPAGEEIGKMMGTTPDARVVPFHFVRRGAFELRTPERKPLVVKAGEVVLLPAGPSHRLSEGTSPVAIPLADILKGRRPRSATSPSRSTSTATAMSTSLVCGVFLMHDVRFNPLFGALPPVLHAPIAVPTAGYVARGVADMLVAEVGPGGGRRSWVVGRLLELLCVEAILVSAASAPHGWLAATRDQSIGTALGAFHQAPGADWTVNRLAKRAGLSPSRFSARFREVLGESPKGYVTAWRMAVAARRLRETDERVDAVGNGVGYVNLPAFSRAFKRQWGCAPSAVRSETASAPVEGARVRDRRR